MWLGPLIRLRRTSVPQPCPKAEERRERDPGWPVSARVSADALGALRELY